MPALQGRCCSAAFQAAILAWRSAGRMPALQGGCCSAGFQPAFLPWRSAGRMPALQGGCCSAAFQAAILAWRSAGRMPALQRRGCSAAFQAAILAWRSADQRSMVKVATNCVSPQGLGGRKSAEREGDAEVGRERVDQGTLHNGSLGNLAELLGDGGHARPQQAVVGQAHGSRLQGAVPVEQDRAVLENGAAVGPHRRADQLAAAHHHLAARRRLEAGNRGGGAGEVQVDLTRGQLGLDPECAAGRHQRLADPPVGVLEGARQRAGTNRSHHRVGQLEVVEQGAAAGRPPHHVDAVVAAEAEIGRLDPLVPAERQARRVPAVQPQASAGRYPRTPPPARPRRAPCCARRGTRRPGRAATPSSRAL